MILMISFPYSAEDKVTEDMLVTHFLIQPDPIGVKLQGWSEKPFSKSSCIAIYTCMHGSFFVVVVVVVVVKMRNLTIHVHF